MQILTPKIMLQFSAKVIIDTRSTKKDNTHSVKLRISYDYQQHYYLLNKSFTKERWDKIMSEKAKGKDLDEQLVLKAIEKRAIDTINSLHPFSLTSFEKKLFKRSYKKSDLLLMMKDYQDELLQKGSKGTSECYKSSESSIKAYLKAKKLPHPIFEDITPEWLTKYEEWMLSRGRSVTTVGIYMRNIRTLMNIAIDKGLLNHEAYPFGKRKYIIPATRNIKKALHKDDIKNIYNYSPISKQEEYAKDMWMFSYLCNGMNIKDIALLKHSSLVNNQIEFIRAKTANTKKQDSKPIRANINSPMRAIMHKWGKHSIDPEEYLFDILAKNDDSEEIFRKVKQTTKNINKYMKKIGVKLGIEQPLTTYVARHSFATILKNSDTSVQYISEALGHTSLQTTAIYLDSFEKEEIEKNQEKLLDF